MTKELVERLRDQQTKWMTPLLGDAADALESQSQELARMRGALEPLAYYDGFLDPEYLSKRLNRLLDDARAALSGEVK